MEKLIDFDPSFRHPFTCMVAGPSKCGKTHLVIDLINANIIDPHPERVIWCFGYYQEAFRRLYSVEFVEGLPKNDLLDGRPTLVVIDDLMLETDARVASLFTKGSHHENASVIYITQNPFNKNKQNRNISLNTHYLILFKNPRDVGQIACLGRQMFPTQLRYFLESFADATALPYGYLLVDLRTTAPDDLRLRTSVLPGENTFAYIYK